ncbi:MAG TPA: response regulator transcription factor [Bryobacteraceae bacterium]|jgi:DNA-binding NarL/FixJ family response regulator
MKARVLIAEDNFLIAEGSLRPTVARDFEVIGLVADGKEAVAAAEQLQPDVVLLDVSLPTLRGFDAARQILVSQPNCKVLFVSNYWDAAYVQAAREMGAGGYVFKSRAPTEIVPAIRSALAGRFYEPGL